MKTRDLISKVDFKKEERFLIHNIGGIETPVLTVIKNSEDAKYVGYDYTISSYLVNGVESSDSIDDYTKLEVVDEPIATINSHIAKDGLMCNNYFKVDSISVNEKYQNQGIGSTMLDMAEDLAMLNKIEFVYIDPYAYKNADMDLLKGHQPLIDRLKQFVSRKYKNVDIDETRVLTECFARANGYRTHDYEMPCRKLPMVRPYKYIKPVLYEDYIKGSVDGKYINGYTDEIESYLK